jgi:hypothetical protein
MSNGLENQRQILNTWIKLEKCLDEFDTEVHREQKARPLSSSITNAKYSQSASKRPGSSAHNIMPGLPEPGGSQPSHLARPMTSFNPAKNRPVSGLSNLRPLTASNTINMNANSSLARTATFNKVINSLQLEHVIMMYEAKCKDNQVE